MLLGQRVTAAKPGSYRMRICSATGGEAVGPPMPADLGRVLPTDLAWGPGVSCPRRETRAHFPGVRSGPTRSRAPHWD